MADRAIKVAVLEGDFAALSNLGLPLSVSLQLQEMGLKLSTALWTVRSTSSGFSVSLFWPNESVTVGRRKRRRRRRAKAKTLGTLGTNAANQYLEPTASPAESPKSSKSGTTHIEAHPVLIRDKSPTPTPTPKQSSSLLLKVSLLFQISLLVLHLTSLLLIVSHLLQQMSLEPRVTV